MRKNVGVFRTWAGTPLANAIGTIVAVGLILTVANDVLALSESPAASASPAAAEAPPAPPPGAMKVVPSEEGASPAPSEAGAPATPVPKRHIRHRAASPPEVEPATARLRVTHAGWIYAEPSKSSKHLEQATPGKFVNVTGSTKYFLQVKLKDGPTGYILPSAVELVKPADKVFMLTHDAAVVDAPNRWAKKLNEVHQSHSVHVIGVALNYMQIRMKSGLVGFIPASALQ